MDFAQRTIDLARQNVPDGGRPFATVIVRDGEILAESANQVAQSHDPTAHAEILAIRAACVKLGTEHLAGATIYVLAHPCPMCLGSLYYCSPDQVVFLTQRDQYEAVLRRRPQILRAGHVLRRVQQGLAGPAIADALRPPRRRGRGLPPVARTQRQRRAPLDVGAVVLWIAPLVERWQVAGRRLHQRRVGGDPAVGTVEAGPGPWMFADTAGARPRRSPGRGRRSGGAATRRGVTSCIPSACAPAGRRDQPSPRRRTAKPACAAAPTAGPESIPRKAVSATRSG